MVIGRLPSTDCSRAATRARDSTLPAPIINLKISMFRPSVNGAVRTRTITFIPALAASDLDDSSNAPFSDNVNAANLFASENNEYTDVYSNVQVPFVYDEDYRLL